MGVAGHQQPEDTIPLLAESEGLCTNKRTATPMRHRGTGTGACGLASVSEAPHVSGSCVGRTFPSWTTHPQGPCVSVLSANLVCGEVVVCLPFFKELRFAETWTLILDGFQFGRHKSQENKNEE